MTMHASNRSGWEPFRIVVGLRGAATAMGMVLLLAGCGQQQGAPPASANVAKTPASAVSAAAPAAVAPAVSTAAPAVASSAAQAQLQQQAAAAQAKLASMSVSELLTAAREAYAQHRLVAPADDNAMAYYEAVLAQDPDNQVAKDALREIFPFSVPDVEKAIARNDFDEADREIALLGKADPTNYTLTLLRSKLDAQKRLVARQQQAQQAAAQKAVELAAAQQAAAQAAAAKAAAESAAQAKLAVQQAAAAKAAAAQPVAPPPPPKPVGITRGAVLVKAAPAQYPIAAARNQTSGYVVVEFTVTAGGEVTRARVVDSSPRSIFDRAALQAIKQYQFKAALQDGEPVASTVRRRINFSF